MERKSTAMSPVLSWNLAGDEARAHAADRLAVEAHGLAAHRRGGGIAHQPDLGVPNGRQRHQHAKRDLRRRKLPGPHDARDEPK